MSLWTGRGTAGLFYRHHGAGGDIAVCIRRAYAHIVVVDMAGEEVGDRHHVIVVIARTNIIAHGYEAVLREAGVRDDAALHRFPDARGTALVIDRDEGVRRIAWAIVRQLTDIRVLHFCEVIVRNAVRQVVAVLAVRHVDRIRWHEDRVDHVARIPGCAGAVGVEVCDTVFVDIDAEGLAIPVQGEHRLLRHHAVRIEVIELGLLVVVLVEPQPAVLREIAVVGHVGPV